MLHKITALHRIAVLTTSPPQIGVTQAVMQKPHALTRNRCFQGYDVGMVPGTAPSICSENGGELFGHG